MNQIYRWIVLIYTLPTKPSGHRVRIWRKLKKLGAVSLKNSVYLLPFNRELHESAQWLSQEIEGIGGEVTLLAVNSIENMPHEEAIDLFRRARDDDYAEIASECRKSMEDLNKMPEEKIPDELEAFGETLKSLRKKMGKIREIDYFRAPKGTEAERALADMKAKLEDLRARYFDGYVSEAEEWKPDELKGRTWVTRERPHIDRVASAWLIKRFIDPDAKFAFIPEGESPGDGIKFDMLGAELSHRGEDCTFETILKWFHIRDKVLKEISEIVHDVDLKDDKFGRQEARGLDALIRGLAEILGDDHKILEVGHLLFDALYSSLGGVARKA